MPEPKYLVIATVYGGTPDLLKVHKAELDSVVQDAIIKYGADPWSSTEAGFVEMINGRLHKPTRRNDIGDAGIVLEEEVDQWKKPGILVWRLGISATPLEYVVESDAKLAYSSPQTILDVIQKCQADITPGKVASTKDVLLCNLVYDGRIVASLEGLEEIHGYGPRLKTQFAVYSLLIERLCKTLGIEDKGVITDVKKAIESDGQAKKTLEGFAANYYSRVLVYTDLSLKEADPEKADGGVVKNSTPERYRLRKPEGLAVIPDKEQIGGNVRTKRVELKGKPPPMN